MISAIKRFVILPSEKVDENKKKKEAEDTHARVPDRGLTRKRIQCFGLALPFEAVPIKKS